MPKSEEKCGCGGKPSDSRATLGNEVDDGRKQVECLLDPERHKVPADHLAHQMPSSPHGEGGCISLPNRSKIEADEGADTLERSEASWDVSSVCIGVRANAPNVPAVLSQNPHDRDFVFERTIWEPPPLTTSTAEVQRCNDLLRSLPENLANELEDEVCARGNQIREAWARARGRDWDPRPDLGVFVIDGQVWRWKDSAPPLPPDATIPDSPPSEGIVSPFSADTLFSNLARNTSENDDSPISLSDFGITLGPFKGPLDGIINEDNRQLVSALTGFNMTDTPWRWIGPGLKSDYNNPFSTGRFKGTGGKVSDRIVVTAGHVLSSVGDRAEGWTAGVDYLGYKNGNALGYHGFPYPLTKADATAIHPKYWDYGVENWDIGIIILPSVWWVRLVGHFGLKSSGILLARKVYSYGYPSDGSKCEAAKGFAPPYDHWPGDGYCGGSMYGMRARVLESYAHEFYTNIDTHDGQSGSPVYRNIDGQFFMVGVHTGHKTTGKKSIACRLGRFKHNWINTYKEQYQWTIQAAIDNQGFGFEPAP